MSWLANNWGLVLALTVDHIRLSAIPILVGFVLAIPIGWCAYRFQAIRGFVLSGVGVLYTIPSLALFMIVPPFLGISVLSELNVMIALSVYALAILVRTVADAFASIEPSVLRSATAMGYAEWGRFFTVELPLAGPVLLAGLRVVAVSTVSLVTVGVLVGVHSLGYLFTDGFQRRIIPEVLVGIVMTVVVALILDGLLLLVGRVLMPWSAVLSRTHKGIA